mgnify:CR=1 FL=1
MDEKNTCVIKLNNIDKVKDFVSRVSTFDCDVDVLYRRYILDAKSIMALLSTDLIEPLKVVIHTDDYDELKRFFEIMGDFK